MLPTSKRTVELCHEAKEFLKHKSKSTRKIYRNGLRHYVTYYKCKYGSEKTISSFLNLLEENSQLPRKQRKRKLAEAILHDYIENLKKKGYANNSIRSYFVAIQNLLNFYDQPISARWLADFPKSVPLPKNRKHQWKLDQIKQFVDHASTYRDKAIILTLFQSGISISDLCRLNYGDIRQQFKDGVLPIILIQSRGKTGVNYRTFLGADAVQYITHYLKTRSDLTDEKPLFTKWACARA